MKLDLKFNENDQKIDLEFGEFQDLTDGGYERGYAEGEIDGYNKGHTDGYNTGYNDGLAKRTYEVWTFTLIDGSIVEKEVALL